MTEGQISLLLEDICARLPYSVKCKYYDCCEGDYDEGTICGFEGKILIQIDGVCIPTEEVKPYLLPLSSMTEEQFNELRNYCNCEINGWALENVKLTKEYHTLEFWVEIVPSYNIIKLLDWLNKNYFDYRGLIDEDLAIDATDKNIY